MNEKQLKILVAAVLVLGLGALLMRNGGGEGGGVSRIGDKVFGDFKINAITRLTNPLVIPRNLQEYLCIS